MATTTTTLKQGLAPFTPLRTQQVAGGSQILDQNLDLIKKHFDALGPIVSIIARTLNINVSGTGGSAGSLTPGGVAFVDSAGIITDDPAKLAYNDTTGVLTIVGLSPGGLVKASATGSLVLATPGTDYMVGPLTGDVTTPSAGSTVTTLVNIPNDTAMAGDILATNVTAPATPAAGKARIYVDSTAKTLTVVNDAGGKSHTVQSRNVFPNFFVNSLSDSGVLGLAQPAFTDISGTVAPAQLGSFTNGSVLFWNSGLAQDNASFSYDTTVHTLTLNGSTPISLPLTGTQIINKSGGALTIRTSTSNGLTLATNSTPAIVISPTQAVNMSSLNAGGVVISTAGQLAIGVAGTDYQGIITWPLSGQVLTSTGTAPGNFPTGDATFTFNQIAHVLAGGNAIGVNGVTVPNNVNLCVGHTTASDRDRSQFFVGGGSLGPSTAGTDSTLFDIFPSSTTINLGVGVLGGIYATQRIRSLSYPGGGIGCAVGVAASLYVDAAPTLVVASGPTYAIYVASGLMHVGGAIDSGSTVSGHSVIATGTAGTAISANGDVGPTLGFFGASPLGQQTGGAASAGAAYTATEQGMLNRAYAALRAYGLLT